MKHTRLWVAASIIAVVIIVGFVLSVPHTRDIPLEKITEVVEPVTPQVALHDVFKKGIHTITGSFDVSNVCVTVTASTTLVGEGIQVALSLSPDDGVCLQLPTTTHFKTTITAPAQAPITVTVNGEMASSTSL